MNGKLLEYNRANCIAWKQYDGLHLEIYLHLEVVTDDSISKPAKL